MIQFFTIRLMIFTFFLASANVLFAQDDISPKIEPPEIPDVDEEEIEEEIEINSFGNEEMAPDEDRVYSIVDTPAGPKNGQEAFEEYIRTNSRNPSKVSGKVYVEFVVEQTGQLRDLKVVRGLNPELDQEAIRLLSNSAPWLPASHEGDKVQQRFVMPISFEAE